MKKLFYNAIISLLLIFSFSLKVNAECSYKERTEMLNEAKKVEISVSPNEKVEEFEDIDTFGDLVTFKETSYSFDFIINNISDNIYVRYYTDFDDGVYSEDEYDDFYIDSNNSKNGLHTFNDSDYRNLYVYTFEIRSYNTNCEGRLITTKKITKPIFNTFSDSVLCENKAMDGNKYCEKFIDKRFNMSESEFITYAQSVIEKSEDNVNIEEDKPSVLDIVKTYWYYIAIPLVIVFVVVIVILIIKRRARLV